MPQKMLVTGGAGFIGSNFIRHILETEAEVMIFNMDVLTYAGNRDNLSALPDPMRHVLVESDICDQARVEKLLREQEIDTIVNFAAETHVDRSILGAAPFIWTNIQGVFSLLEAAKKVWIDEQQRHESCRFLHISTDEVYGTLAADDPAFTENTPYAPSSPYSASKASGDMLVRAYGTTYGLPILITNCSNNYGPYQYPEKLIPVIVLNALQGKELPIYGDGKQIRDWLYVIDHVRAIWQVLTAGKPGETYNIGAGVQPTNLEVVDTICSILDELKPDSACVPHARLKRFVTDRPGHDRRYAVDPSKINSELGWRPQVDFEQGLLETVKWYLDNLDWVEAIRNKPEYQAWVLRNYSVRPK